MRIKWQNTTMISLELATAIKQAAEHLIASTEKAIANLRAFNAALRASGFNEQPAGETGEGINAPDFTVEPITPLTRARN